jgi:hypothetical protein
MRQNLSLLVERSPFQRTSGTRVLIYSVASEANFGLCITGRPDLTKGSPQSSAESTLAKSPVYNTVAVQIYCDVSILRWIIQQSVARQRTGKHLAIEYALPQ